MKNDLFISRSLLGSNKKPVDGEHDRLTGLLNKTGFLKMADAEKKSLEEKGLSPVLLFFDLNNLKSFNYKYGFPEGTQLLHAFARLLGRWFGEENCARLRLDHFTVLTEEAGLEEKLENLIREGRKINDGKNVPFCVGIYPFRTEEIPILVACERAKFAGDSLKNSYVSGYTYYDDNLEKLEKKNQYLAETLERAIREGLIEAYYMPVIRATNRRVCEEEALARWDDPVYGFLKPPEFLPALEEAGITYKLDLFMIDQILQKIRYMETIGMQPVAQSVNLSRSDFDACDMVEEIVKRVDEAGVDRHLLIIELKEGIIGRDYEFMREQIDRFRSQGFRVWMDDFGSGYTSLNLLQSMPVDLIKFDLCYMKSFESGSPGKIILTELAKLAIGLGIDMICEGVETEEEAIFLKEIGCEKLQGYFYNKPISLETIVEIYQSGQRPNGAEAPDETAYYDAIGQINLYDLAIVAQEGHGDAKQYFDSVPMGILEIKGDEYEFLRLNQSYQDFVQKKLGYDLDGGDEKFNSSDINAQTSFMKFAVQCSKEKSKSLITEKLPDKTTVHSLVRWIADNPRTGASAIAIVVLAVTDAANETTYENIAKALAADYFKLYYVDLETEQFIEYRSDPGEEELAVERHGTAFFRAIRKNARDMIYEEDVENFVFSFTKENIVRSLKQQGTFTLSYRQLVEGEPVHVSLKAMRLSTKGREIIIGINIVEAQARLEEGFERKVFSNAVSGTEAARFGAASLSTVSFVVKSCVKLMETGDFTENVQAVLWDIMKESQSDAVRILLLDPKEKKASLFADVNEETCDDSRRESVISLDYEMVAGWEMLTDGNQAIMIQDEESMNELEAKAASWVATMRKDGVKRICLIPLRRADRTLGYLYACNFNEQRASRTKELVELVSYFLGSEIESYLFRRELEILSNYDELTGLKNRYAMLNRVNTMEREHPEIPFAILTMDLNGLKRLNDTEGHFAGDALIIKTANFLRAALGPDDLFRIGGDEFIKVFPNITKEEFEKTAERFREVDLPASGVSLAIGPFWSENSEDVEHVFYEADLNMYADKRAFYERHPELKGSRS